MIQKLNLLFNENIIKIEDLYNIIDAAKEQLKNQEFKSFSNQLNLLLLKSNLTNSEINEIKNKRAKNDILGFLIKEKTTKGIKSSHNHTNKTVFKEKKLFVNTPIKVKCFNIFYEEMLEEFKSRKINLILKDLEIGISLFEKACIEKKICTKKIYLNTKELRCLDDFFLKPIRKKYKIYKEDLEIKNILNTRNKRKTVELSNIDRKYIDKKINGESTSVKLISKGFYR